MENPYDHTQDALYEAKRQCMLKNNVTILKQSKCKEYVDYVIDIYGKWILEEI